MIPYIYHISVIVCILFVVVKIYFDRQDKITMDNIMGTMKQSKEEHRKSINNLRGIKNEH